MRPSRRNKWQTTSRWKRESPRVSLAFRMNETEDLFLLMPQPRSDSSSSSDTSDSDSSSESDSTMAAPQAAGRQRNRRGRGQRAVSPSDDMIDDDDGESGVASSKTAPKTEHEIAEPEIALPSVQKLDEAVELAKFGKVESVIENVVVVRADTSGNYRVLDEGTVVCWEDRTVIGNVRALLPSTFLTFRRAHAHDGSLIRSHDAHTDL